MCQNDQNFANIKILRHVHVRKYEKSSTCQNDQNFMNIKNIKAHVCACKWKKSSTS